MSNPKVFLTPEQAAATTFPDGCPVLYCANSDKFAPLADQNVVLVGTVQSVSIDVTQGASKDFLYHIKFLQTDGSEIAKEKSLRFAPRCPVKVRDLTRLDETWLDGTIMSSYDVPSFGSIVGGNDEAGSSCFYSAWVELPDGKTTTIHGVPADSVKFRPTEQLLCSLDPSIQQGIERLIVQDSADHKSGEVKGAAHLEVENDGETHGGDAGRVDVAAAPSGSNLKDEHGGEDHSAERHDSKPIFEEYCLDVPEWLSKSEVTGFLVGKGGEKKHQLEQRTKCRIKITGKGSGSRMQDNSSKDHMEVIIRARSGKYWQNVVGRARREVEDLLIKYVGKDKSRGRLLYELGVRAREAADKKAGGVERDSSATAVFQRAYYDLSHKVWMDIVELPYDRRGNVHGRFLVGPHGETIKRVGEESNCRIAVHGAFEEEMLCDPYVVISAEEVSSVAKGRRAIRAMIREHQEGCPMSCSQRRRVGKMKHQDASEDDVST